MVEKLCQVGWVLSWHWQDPTEDFPVWGNKIRFALWKDPPGSLVKERGLTGGELKIWREFPLVKEIWREWERPQLMRTVGLDKILCWSLCVGACLLCSRVLWASEGKHGQPPSISDLSSPKLSLPLRPSCLYSQAQPSYLLSIARSCKPSLSLLLSCAEPHSMPCWLYHQLFLTWMFSFLLCLSALAQAALYFSTGECWSFLSDTQVSIPDFKIHVPNNWWDYIKCKVDIPYSSSIPPLWYLWLKSFLRCRSQILRPDLILMDP